mgnify:CR=1 FL=1
MRVWIDFFSGDEMVSDSYKSEFIFNDACLEVQAKFVSKNDNVKIAGKYMFKLTSTAH